jgi:purine-binding chemotaxis protein CheW
MTAGTRDYILFSISGTTYAVRSDDVRHMEMIEHVTPVPNASGYLDGVVFSRGQIVPVLNLRARFGFERIPYDLGTRLLVAQSGDRWVGLVVDSAREFTRIPDTAVQPPSHALTSLSTDYVEGVATLGERLVLVLNIAKVLDAAVLGAAAPGGTAPAFRGGAARAESEHHGG